MRSPEEAWKNRAHESIKQACALVDEAERHIAELDATRQTSSAMSQSNNTPVKTNSEKLFKPLTLPKPETPPTDPKAALLMRLSEAQQKLETALKKEASRSEHEYWKSRVEELNHDLARLAEKEAASTPSCIIA